MGYYKGGEKYLTDVVLLVLDFSGAAFVGVV